MRERRQADRRKRKHIRAERSRLEAAGLQSAQRLTYFIEHAHQASCGSRPDSRHPRSATVRRRARSAPFAESRRAIVDSSIGQFGAHNRIEFVVEAKTNDVVRDAVIVGQRHGLRVGKQADRTAETLPKSRCRYSTLPVRLPPRWRSMPAPALQPPLYPHSSMVVATGLTVLSLF